MDLNTSWSRESRLTVMRLSPAALRARALRLRSEPLVVTVRSSSPSIVASMAMSCSTSVRTSGSPPVMRSFLTPWATKMRARRVVSSKVRISLRARNSKPRPKTSFGMQYVQRKLQRSVTEIRRSCRGRRSVSVRKLGPAAAGLRGRVRLPSLIEQLLEEGPGAHGGAAAMADHVLDVGRQLRHRPRLLRQVEDRVVSESQLSSRLKGDEALHLALEQPHALRALPIGRQARLGDGDYATEARPALFRREVSHPAEDVLEPLLEAGVFPQEAGGTRPRRAVQGVNLKAGVIGEGDEAAGLGAVERLYLSILLVGLSGLVVRERQAEGGGRDES